MDGTTGYFQFANERFFTRTELMKVTHQEIHHNVMRCVGSSRFGCPPPLRACGAIIFRKDKR